MPEEEPVCDCEEGEPPDADPGCCGADTCEENETCCNETTCVLTSTFQTDSSNCGGCDIVCAPEETCVAGSCVGDGTGCCYTAVCAYNSPSTPGEEYNYEIVSFTSSPEDCSTAVPNECAGVGYSPGDRGSYGEALCNEGCVGGTIYIWSPEPCPDPCESANCGARRYKWVYGNVFANPYYSGGSWALVSDCNASGDDYICSPSNSNPPGPILGSCGGAFAAYHTWLCSEFGEIPGVDCQASGPHEIIGSGPCFDVDCTCEPSGGGLSVPSDRPVEVTERPCYQEECETQVSTWMAEPSGEPNEEGLYKVKWILLDDCPGACCSDQPTQPEFVKTSTLVDAPCKCGCN